MSWERVQIVLTVYKEEEERIFYSCMQTPVPAKAFLHIEFMQPTKDSVDQKSCNKT